MSSSLNAEVGESFTRDLYLKLVQGSKLANAYGTAFEEGHDGSLVVDGAGKDVGTESDYGNRILKMVQRFVQQVRSGRLRPRATSQKQRRDTADRTPCLYLPVYASIIDGVLDGRF